MESNHETKTNSIVEAKTTRTEFTSDGNITPHQNWSLAQHLMARYAEMEAGYRISRGIAPARNQHKQAEAQGDQL